MASQGSCSTRASALFEEPKAHRSTYARPRFGLLGVVQNLALWSLSLQGLDPTFTISIVVRV